MGAASASRSRRGLRVALLGAVVVALTWLLAGPVAWDSVAVPADAGDLALVKAGDPSKPLDRGVVGDAERPRELEEGVDEDQDQTAAFASFDTEVRGPFGKGAPTIAKELEGKGYRSVAKPEGFIVQGKYGPLKDGELDRARRWGASLRAVLAPAG